MNRFQWLTARERLVLRHLMEGMSAEDICQAEHLSMSTVRSHIRSILMKLGVNSQLAAVALAYRTFWPVDVCRETALGAMTA